MPDPRITEIEKLIIDYRAADKDMTEANVEAAFVARLFAVLGWTTDDPTVWNRQVFVRGGGFADVGLQIQNTPVLFVEAKRFGKLKGPAKAVQAALFGEDVVLSQSDRQRAGIDRTPEEKQAMRYARAQEVPWAVLTNFERLVLFDANEERIVLAFDAPEEYLSRFDDLKVLAPQPTPQQFHSHLNWYKGLQKKADVDADFFEFLSRWRVRLAQDMFDRDAKRDEPLFHPPTSERLERLMEAVQRVLDRLIILRYADDVGVLLQHDLLENLLAYHHGRLAYVQEHDFQREVNRLFHDFYRAHNTTIFAPGHVCEQALIGNDCLVNLVREISSISFRKFSSDILGNTYESYLGQKLQLVDGQLVPEARKDVRKGEGIYYTPGYIVRYIVDHTLGRWLYGTENGQPDGPLVAGEHRKTPSDRSAERSRRSLASLRVLDPAMGSGSFLIYAFDVLADFYERENARIEAENKAAWDAWGERALKEGMFGKEDKLPPPQLQPTVSNYIEKILQEHLYGVDLDPEAVEIAGVNLIMAAFRRLTRNRQPHRKLPLILRQNLKCGNSLISGDRGEEINEEECNKALVQLIQLRGELREQRDDAARAAKLAEIEAAVAPLTAALNESLRPYFGDEVAAKRPFNWAVEFPEAFDPRLQEAQRGFTVVVGNPPYGLLDDPQEQRAFFAKFPAFDIPENYVAFWKQGIDLLCLTGAIGYIVPVSWWTGARYKNAREYTLHTCQVGELIRLPFDVFKDAYIDAGISIAFKKQHYAVSAGFVSGTAKVYEFGQRDDPSALSEGVNFGEVSSGDWVKDERLQFVLDTKVVSLREKLAMLSSVPLGQISESGRGIPNIQAATEQLPGYYPLFSGQIYRYQMQFETTGWAQRPQADTDIFTGPRLLVRRLLSRHRRLMATYTEIPFLNEERILSFVITSSAYDPLHVLALLNSRLFSYLYIAQSTIATKDDYPQVTLSNLRALPICQVDTDHADSQTMYNVLGNLAKRMLDLNRAKQEAERAFARVLRGCERETASLWRAYWDHAEYRPHLQRQPLLDANATGEVSAVSVDEEPATQSLLIRAEVDGDWQDVARLTIPDEDFRLFLFFALRQFLHENRRKKVWARGRVLRGLLETLHVPVLEPASAAANLARVAQLMADLRAQCPSEALHLSEVERILRETDAEIDRRVYDLYGLTEEERRVVEESVR